MFGYKSDKSDKLNKLEGEKKALEIVIESLRSDVREAKDDLADTKHERKMSDEDIKHMVKIAKEKDALTLQKKVMDCDSEKEKAIAKVKDEYRDKMEERLQKEVEGIKEMYGQILERLPNVNARLKGDI